MKITKIEEQKRNKRKYNIYIDGEYHSSILKDIVDEMKFSEGMELNEDEFNQKLEIIQYKSALREALLILTRSSKTEKELKQKLKEKSYSEKTIDQVTKYLGEIGYINDESYTESFIGLMKNTTGTSSRSLYYKLAGKGIDVELVQQKLDEADIDDFASAMKAAQKKASGLKGDKREKSAKLIGFLYRKGYGMDVCRRVIEELDLEEEQ
ncbi:MAG: hypothetical protein ACM3ZR_00945 [Pseudomonadota bacterium]